MKPTYKLIENIPYDTNAPKTWWIIKSYATFFGLIKRTKLIGSGEIDNIYGEMGDMPFFSRKSAKKYLKQLRKV